MKLKNVAKQLLREIGLLKFARNIYFRFAYRKWISQAGKRKIFEVSSEENAVKFSLEDPFSATFFGYHFKNGVYEEDALKTILSLLTIEDVFADVGANIGYFTCTAATKVSQGKVYAFEMGKENTNILARNIELNGLKNVHIEHCAVADSSGTVFHEESSVGNAVLRILADNRNNNPDVVSIRSISLDDFFNSRDKVPVLVKIDVEGAEMKVLKGMQKLLSGHIKILIEIHEKELRYFQSSREEVLEYLESFGFTLQSIGNDVKKNNLVLAIK